MPTQKPSPRKRGFLIAPFPVQSRREIKRGRESYRWILEHLTPKFIEHRGPQGEDFSESICKTGVGKRRAHGLLLNYPKLVQRVPEPEIYSRMFSACDPEVARAAEREILATIKQLHSIGHGVSVMGSNERSQRIFIRAAMRHGAKSVEAKPLDHWDSDIDMQAVLPSMRWARDEYVRIGTKKERPNRDIRHVLTVPEPHYFGEGGKMIQIGPKDFAIHKSIAGDPRIGKYESMGFRFFPLPEAFVYDRNLSELMGTKIYLTHGHIDLVLGGVPERRVVAVDPRYYKEHKMSLQLLERNAGVRLVEVPEEEADRHPACFLPLGRGRVLVDRGAPKFIKRLRKAGATVVPTTVPLDSLLAFRGGLHCLFNEA